MKREIIYTDAPPEIEEAIANGRIIENFLPAPEFLVRRKSKEQIVVLSNSSDLTFRAHTHARSSARKFATAGA
ncbi:MAG: hypothetical protein LBN27_06520 [Prevotellaceae bacterium]|nr:hypothetical protein [Prevotellaceae bacterium]